jgi:hypothetical protein
MSTDHSRLFNQYRSSSLMHISDLFPTVLSAASSATAEPSATSPTDDGIDQWKFLTSGFTDCNQVSSGGEIFPHQTSPPPRSTIIHDRFFFGDYRGGGDTNNTIMKDMIRLSGVVSSGSFKLIFEPKKLTQKLVQLKEEPTGTKKHEVHVNDKDVSKI